MDEIPPTIPPTKAVMSMSKMVLGKVKSSAICLLKID